MAFGRGNFVGAALAGSFLGTPSAPISTAPPEAALQAAAGFGLIGGGPKALAALAAIDSPEARLYHALAAWIDSQDDEAERQLALAPPSPATTALQALLRKDRIRTLCFLPPHRSGPHGLFDAQISDPRFERRNVWFYAAPDDGIPNKVDADIHHFYRANQVPDLLVAEMVEWHVLPRNIADLPCFKVGHTSDFDIHGQEVMPWLAQFDATLTLDHTEWERLCRALPGQAIFTYPKAFTVQERELQFDNRERPIDVLMTGTVLSDFHQDKNELVTQLRHLPGVRSLLLNGFVSQEEYEAITALSKLTLSFVRHSGTMPTRALESMALGTWSILQDDSALRLYLPENAAVLPYRHGDWAAFKRDITSFIASFPERQEEYAERARITAAAIFEQFNPTRVATQYFRFCAALPAIKLLLQQEAKAAAPRPEIQKRGCVVKGWLPAYGEEGVLRSLLERNVDRLKQIGGAEALNQIGREYLIEYARLVNKGDLQPALLDSALEAFAAAVAADGSALAPRFNEIRALYHFGNTEQHDLAEAAARTFLSLADDPAKLHLAAFDDLLPYDFYPSHFNGQSCSEHRLAAFGGNADELAHVRQLVIASVHYYLARGLGNRAEASQHYQRAIDLDPENPHFQLGYSLYLLATNAKERGSALEYIGYSATETHWTPMLGNLLRQVAPERARSDTAPSLYFDIEDEVARQFRYHQGRNLTMTGERYRGRRNISSVPRLYALVLCGSGITANPALPEALHTLRRKVSNIEIVVIDTLLDVEGSPLAAHTDLLVSAPQAGTMAYSSMVIADLLPEIRAPYTFIAQPETTDFAAIAEHVIRFTTPQPVGVNITSFPNRPLLLTRHSATPGVTRDLLCISAGTQIFRDHNLPQRTGMLQAANLALPLLMHQLRPGANAFYMVSYDTGQVYPLDRNDELLDINDYIAAHEDTILRLVSPNWRRAQEEIPPRRRKLVISVDQPDPMLLPPPSAETPDAAPAWTDSGQSRGNMLMAFDRDSAMYRLARSLYRRYLRRNNLDPRNIDARDLSISLGFLRFEYVYPRLRVKLQVPNFIAKRIAR